jgi:hypothetical protein
MAQVKVYRVAYTIGDANSAEINFSKWVKADGISEILADLPHHLGISTPILVVAEGEEVEITPVILGWEEKKLDTDP